MQSVLNLKSAPLNNRRIKEQKRERCTLQEFIQSEVSIHSRNLKQPDLLQDRRARNIAFHLTLQKGKKTTKRNHYLYFNNSGGRRQFNTCVDTKIINK